MRGTLFSIVVLLSALLPAQAQTLKLTDALTRLRWDAVKRGPLLLLDTPRPVAGTLDDEWTSEQLAAALNLQAVNMGGVTSWISPTKISGDSPAWQVCGLPPRSPPASPAEGIAKIKPSGRNL